ncbi:MAG: ribosome small subunit-dependent GTPase A [Ignavibacteriales bacterium]|nr:ribosome small subunit-dependent GTPase A [Ignavibacteriales bacterium]
MRLLLKGKLKKGYTHKDDKMFHTDIVVVGDRARYSLTGGDAAAEEILERRNWLSRKAPKRRGARAKGERMEQVIAANLDRLLVVVSMRTPDFNNRALDRFLVAGESAGVPTAVALNKIDLDESGEHENWARLYRDVGYEVYPTSAATGEGVGDVREELLGKTTLVWGASGVGKTSLLNAAFPDLALPVSEVSEATSKGKHTTVVAKMHEPTPGAFVVDTPGVREIEPYGVEEGDLRHYFPEFEPFNNECRYARCTHSHEPGCAAEAAVEAGEISVERFESYLRMLATIEDEPNY